MSKNAKYLIVPLGFAFGYLLLCLFIDPLCIGMDQSLYLYSGKLILKGQVPFVDFFEINPPLIMYLSAAIVWIANVIQISDIAAHQIFVAVLVTIFLLGINYFFKQELSPAKRIILISTLIFVFANEAVFGILGQRDHLFAMGLLLYILLKVKKVSSIGGKPHAAIIFLVSFYFGICMSLKPFFILHFIATETLEMFFLRNDKVRKVSNEAIVIISIQLAYLGLLALQPESAKSYFWFSHIFKVAKYYNSFRVPFTFRMESLLLLTPLLALFWVRFLQKAKNALFSFLFLNLVVAMIVYFAQFKFFTYHIASLELLSIFTIAFVLLAGPETKSIKTLSLIALVSWQLMYCKKIEYFFSIGRRLKQGRVESFSSLTRFLKENTQTYDYILPLSSSVGISYPVLNYLELNLASRYLFQYPLSFYGANRFKAENQNDRSVQLSTEEVEYRDELFRDIERYHPKVIFYFVGTTFKQNLPPGFSIEAYMDTLGVLNYLNEQNYKLKEKTNDGFVFFVKTNGVK